MNDIRPQVTDIEIRKTAGIEAGLSLKKAWDIMRGARIVSLPILEDEKLAESLQSVILLIQTWMYMTT